MNPICPISVIDKLSEEISKDRWVNVTAQKRVLAGVQLAKQRLIREGFIKVNEDELCIEPTQMELPLDYGTILSNQK